jgi:hypothetical protein
VVSGARLVGAVTLRKIVDTSTLDRRTIHDTTYFADIQQDPSGVLLEHGLNRGVELRWV